MADADFFQDLIGEDLNSMTNDEISHRIAIYENQISIVKSNNSALRRNITKLNKEYKENIEKIKNNKLLPYLVSHVVETIDLQSEEESTDIVRNDEITEKSVVIKTSSRQVMFLPSPGLVDADDLQPGDLVGVNKDSFLIFEKLPPEFDGRVKSMEVEEKPSDSYAEIGGLDKQIQELREAVVLPLEHGELFEKLGIHPPKGVLLYGPPGTGKTLLARACAAQTDAVFLKLSGTQIVQKFIGDGARMIRDAFSLAKSKIEKDNRKGAIIFIDELDAIGSKRFDSDHSSDREVQRTMLELLNQLDGFTSYNKIKIIGATNRPDSLDPALLRSGRLDRKIELPLPSEESRIRILKIHSRNMSVDVGSVNYEELARITDDFNGAQLKAVCVEAGMFALRRNSDSLTHEDFVEAVAEVSAKKKTSLLYYA